MPSDQPSTKSTRWAAIHPLITIAVAIVSGLVGYFLQADQLRAAQGQLETARSSLTASQGQLAEAQKQTKIAADQLGENQKQNGIANEIKDRELAEQSRRLCPLEIAAAISIGVCSTTEYRSETTSVYAALP